MRPWQTTSRKQIAFWIRDAAMVRWISGGDANNWRDSRQDDGWTEDDCNVFLKHFESEINKAEKDLESWIDGEANIT